MSESQQPKNELDDESLFEQAEHGEANAEVNEASEINETDLDADAIEHGQFDDASDDFAYEEQDDVEEELEGGDVEAFDYDDAAEEVVAESDDDDSLPTRQKRKRGARTESFADTSGLDDGDNDPAPRRREQTSHGTQAAQFAPQRLAKILAAAGVDARRKCEEYVTTGRVTVDGEVITDVAFRADPYSQKIELDGERVKLQRKVYFALNKPCGVVCTNRDPAGRPRVIDLFPQFKERLFAIGRLDEESDGLLLVTNDGELANRMAHPRYRVAKFYLCHVKGVPSAETLASLKRGMYFEEGKFHVEGVRMKKAVGDSAYLEIVLNEGQNREIRRLMARVGHKVMRLKRVGFGPIRLGDLPSGAFRPLSTDEMKLLKDLSEQRAHLDNTAGRGRKKQFGDKPAFGGKPKFGSKPPFEKSSYGQPPRGGKPAFGQSSYGKKSYGSQSNYGTQSSYGNRPPRRKFVSQTDDEVIDFTSGEEANQENTSQRRSGGRPRPGGTSQGGYAQGGQRRYSRRNDDEQVSGPPRGQRRSARRDDDQGADSQGGQRRYSRGGGTGYGQGGPRGRTGYGQGGPANRRRSSQSEGDGQQAGYSSRPPRTGQGGGGASGNRRPPRRFQNDAGTESAQAHSTENDFDGGRRRFVTDDTPESSFTRRPARGARPQRRPVVSDEGAQPQESSGDYSTQRRPARGPRRYGQAGNRELPARGRGQRAARPPRPMTADGKEILQGKVTGYRTTPKEGLGRRRRKAVDGMQVNRKQRQQRRRKTEE